MPTLLPLLALLGCAGERLPPPEPPVIKDPGTPHVPDDAAALAVATNRFGAALWRAVDTGPGDVVVSPASIAAALAMTASGARGETAEELTRVLRSTGSGWGALVDGLEREGRGGRVRVANRLFGDESYTFVPDWLSATEREMGATLQPLDFRHAPDASRVTINDWVAERTAGAIRDLLPPDGVSAATRLVVVNAVHFLGRWEAPFDAALTAPAPFSAPSGTRDVPTMHLTTSLRVGAMEGATVLELPYERGDTTMMIVLPDPGVTLDTGEDAFDQWYAALGGAELVRLSLPRFEIRPASAMRLRGTLEGMGVRLAFDPDRADFTGMANPPAPEDRLYVSEVFHSAFVRVDEEGTEAAAATAASMALRMSLPPPAREIRVDRPFVFAIRDSATGLVLFVGRVSEP